MSEILYIMAIKNKDASVYKLSSPNPIIIKQELWSNDEIVTLKNVEEFYNIVMLY